MVIKSRKWKSSISFGAFFLSISLLLANGLPLVQEIVWALRNGVPMTGMEQDYQNTAGFRNQMEEYLADFLAMAAGEEPGAFGYGGYYASDVVVEDDLLENYITSTVEDTGVTSAEGSGNVLGSLFGNSVTATAVAEQSADATSENGVYGTSDGSAASGGGAQGLTDAQKKAAADKFHESMCKDRNLLYRVSYDGEVLYTNMAATKWRIWGDKLPDGYNFAMQYQGSHVKIEKDGKEIDVYGDGYYDGGDDWYVPGYQNFTADEALNKAEVVMFAAEEPRNYTNIRYGRGTSIQSSSLYWLYEDTAQSCVWLHRKIAGLVVGAALFILYLRMRRDKREADVWIGAITGKIWFEVKLLLFAVIVVFAGIYTVVDVTYGYVGNGVWGYAYESSLDSARYPVLLLLLWSIYFAVNDIRRNPHTFWRGLISRFVGVAETKSLSLSFSKRMVRRFVLVVLVGVLCGVGAVIFVTLNYNHFYQYTEALYWGSALLALTVFAGMACWYLVKTKRQAKDLDLLVETIHVIHDGDYGGDNMGTKTALPEDSELAAAAAELDDIRNGMEAAVEERMKSERMKVELVANVSHDIKTPLTSIISYIQFLKQEEDLPEHVKDYIRILDEKSERLNNMVQDVFSVSKAASGQLPVELETLDFGKLLRQTLADMAEEIERSSVTIKAQLPEAPVYIRADGKRMYRVFQNLVQNALRYSLDGSRVFLTLQENGRTAAASIKNTSKQELSGDKDFTERFVRGDESRTDGGSGLGLSIARSFTEACGGAFQIETIADLFVVTVEFARVEE